MYLFVGLTEILRPKTKQSKAEWETATRNLWKRIKFGRRLPVGLSSSVSQPAPKRYSLSDLPSGTVTM